MGRSDEALGKLLIRGVVSIGEFVLHCDINRNSI